MHDGVVRMLCDVRPIPKLKKNLISLGALHANDFGYKTHNDCIKVNKGVLIVMKEKMTTRNIYRLVGDTVVGGAAVAESDHDSTTLWHMRLGHLGESGMAELYKKGLLKGILMLQIGFL